MNNIGFATLLLYVFCVLWRPQDYILLVLNQPILFGLQTLALLFWLFGRKKTLAAPQYLYLMGLLVGVLISSVLTQGVRIGFGKATDFLMLQVVVFILIANATDTVERQRRFFAVYALGTLVIALHTLDQAFDPDRIGWTGMSMLGRNDFGEEQLFQPRYIGIFGDPNDLGMVLVSSLPFIIYFLFQAKNILARVPLLLCLALHLWAIYLTNSRGTLLAVAGMVGIWGVLRYGGFRILVRLMFVMPIVPIIVPSRFYLSGDGSSDERISAWYEGTQMFLSNPLFGVGQGVFLDHHHLTAHNSWVLVFAELGYFGYYFWIALIFTSLYMLWVCQRTFQETGLPSQAEIPYNRERLLAMATMYALLGVLACAFFISRSYVIIFYILTALAAAQYHRYRKQYPQIHFKPMSFHMLWLSAVFFIVINLVIRLNT